MSDFTRRVKEVVKTIPECRVATYAAVAKLAGRPKAARAVGVILKNNDSPEVPCHRVVRSDGGLGGYNGLRGVDKARLLRTENITIINGFIDLNKHQWTKTSY